MRKALILVLLTACGEDVPPPDPVQILDSAEMACWGVVPELAYVVSDSQTYTNTGGALWACAGADVTIQERDWTVIAEPGAVVRVNASGATVWARAGSEVEFNGTSSVVFAESGADIIDTVAVDEIACAMVRVDASRVQNGCPPSP